MDEAAAGFLRERAITADLLRTEPGSRGRLTAETRRALRQLEGPSGRSGRLSPRSYNVTISHGSRFIWFRVAKVATRTVLGYFLQHDVALDVVAARRMRYPTQLFEDYYKFSFVRHPHARFLSAWRDKVVDQNYFEFDATTLARMQDPRAFLDWTAGHDLDDLGRTDQHVAHQSRLVDLSQIDFLGRLESFEGDFATICADLQLPAPAPVHQNRTGGGAAPVDPELAVAVHEVYRKDFQILGYPRPGDPALPPG
ncbi:MAG: sulfotransferase family protein [Nocardioides sp.]|nr:sulfotransferase family protein [Nocardioides sp.]